MMDYLATFNDTRAVLEAEQILVRRRIPFETVPHSHYSREGCGLAIIFEDIYIGEVRKAIQENELKMNLVQVDKATPS